MDQAGRLIVHAPSVRSGGGIKLLKAVLAAARETGDCVALVNGEVLLDDIDTSRLELHRFANDPVARLRAEFQLRKIAKAEDRVLAFGNLPPMFRLASPVILFLQNRYLVDFRMGLSGLSFPAQIRTWAERAWLKLLIGHVQRIVVQTPKMAQLSQSWLTRTAEILPFSDTASHYVRALAPARTVEPKYDFVYVATAEPHKNHERLLEAWGLLAEEGIMPSLCLTLRAPSEAQASLEDLRKIYPVRIENVGVVPQQRVSLLYAEAGALVYPSLAESFGLPLIEARQANLPIIASELDYVRDVVDPEESFDPNSARSIARAIKRHLGLSDPALPLCDARTFLSRLDLAA